MNVLVTKIGGIRLPSGARVLSADTFYTTTINTNDTYTERIMLDVCGHDVQVLRYDRKDTGLVVYIDRRPAQMDAWQVEGYIRANT